MREYTVSVNEEGRRTVQFLRKLMPEAPSGFIYRALREKNIKVNHKKASPELVLSAGDTVELYFSDERLQSLGYIGGMESATPSETGTKRPAGFPEIPVLFEDDRLIVWNKPAGVLSQKDSPDGYSLSEYASDHLRAAGVSGTFSAGVANRLDRNTTGIVLSAKDLAMSQSLSEAIRLRNCRKEYLAVAEGECARKGRMLLVHRFRKDQAKNKASVEAVASMLLPDDSVSGEEAWREFVSGREKSAREEGWIACTASVLSVRNGYSVFCLELLTGKSHQLRAQLACEGYPLLGDVKYGSRDSNRRSVSASRPLLHAFRFTFKGAEGPVSAYNGKTFEAPIPQDMKRFFK